MRRIIGILAWTWGSLAGLGAGSVQAVEEGYVIRCESRRERDNYCTADTSGGVVLRRTLSKSACIEGQSWGFDATGIWVRKGCRADFDVPRAYSSGRGWSSQRGYGRFYRDGQQAAGGSVRVLCESRGKARVLCPVDGIQDVDLVHERSRERCRYNVSWGFDDKSIWVEQGCRAEFLVN